MKAEERREQRRKKNNKNKTKEIREKYKIQTVLTKESAGDI